MIRQETASLSTSRYNLSQVTLVAPFDGIVTRRNIEEGENVVVGTMNNAGTQLLTVADMSIIEAEVEVDETEIPTVKIGQVAKVTIDALPGETFSGHVTEIGNSPIQTTAQSGSGTAGDELQGDRPARSRHRRGTTRVHVLGGNHDGHATAGVVGTDSGDGRARARLRRGRQDRPGAARRQEEAAQLEQRLEQRVERHRRSGAGEEEHRAATGAQARAEAQGNRGSVRPAGTASPSSCR